MSRRVVLFTFGTRGDLYPFIAIALALRARGASAVIAGRPEFEADVRAEGLEFVPIGPTMADLGATQGRSVEDMLRLGTHPRTGAKFLFTRILMPTLETAAADALAASHGADILVVHPLSIAGRLAAERRGLPWLSAVMQPGGMMSAHDPPTWGVFPVLDRLRPLLPAAVQRAIMGAMAKAAQPWFAPLSDLRQRWGLPPATYTLIDEQVSPHGVLALYSPLFGKAQPDFPPRTTICGFPIYDGADRMPPKARAALEAFLAAGEPPVVISAGSGAGSAPFFETSLTAVRRAGRRTILLAGDAALQPCGDDVLIAPSLPHSLVLPRAAAVIHQAGVGASAQALRAGRPQLLAPMVNDQHDNARRLAALGVGQVVPSGRFTEALVARRLQDILADRQMTARAQALAGAIAGEDGAAAAAEAILAG